jgi:uncharacterized membrane protein YhiD involved in acid resistance
MDAGAIIALISVVATLLTVILGGIIRYLVNKIERQENKFEAKLELAERTADAKQETIDELRRQVDRLEITAVIQDRLLGRLPQQLPPPSGDA